MTNINFKTKSIMKNMKRCLKASNHIQNGEIVRFSTGSKHKVIFPRNRNVDEIIKLIMKLNNGYVTSKDLDNYGIHRMYLNIMRKNGIIEKVGNGIYIDANKIEDSYYVFCLSMPNIIFT